jgi:hypothetical protein
MPNPFSFKLTKNDELYDHLLKQLGDELENTLRENKGAELKMTEDERMKRRIQTKLDLEDKIKALKQEEEMQYRAKQFAKAKELDKMRKALEKIWKEVEYKRTKKYEKAVKEYEELMAEKQATQEGLEEEKREELQHAFSEEPLTFADVNIKKFGEYDIGELLGKKANLTRQLNNKKRTAEEKEEIKNQLNIINNMYNEYKQSQNVAQMGEVLPETIQREEIRNLPTAESKKVIPYRPLRKNIIIEPQSLVEKAIKYGKHSELVKKAIEKAKQMRRSSSPMRRSRSPIKRYISPIRRRTGKGLRSINPFLFGGSIFKNEQDIINRFNLLEGEIRSGNNNKKLKQEFGELIKYMYEHQMISKRNAMNASKLVI